jgi:hypothetical protein
MNEERYRWLCNLKCNQLYLTRNEDHACNYMTAREWIEQHAKDFDEVDPAELEQMKATNTIWSLQIYPDTPIGFYKWYGATADSVIDAAMKQIAERCV